MFSGLCKNICLMESGVKLFQTKLLSRLSFAVFFPLLILLRKFTHIVIATNRILQPFTHAVYLPCFFFFLTIDSVFREEKVPSYRTEKSFFELSVLCLCLFHCVIVTEFDVRLGFQLMLGNLT